MGPIRFDGLVRAVGRATTRRGALGVLAAVAGLALVALDEETSAAGRRQRRQGRHHPGEDRDRRQRRRKGKDNGKGKSKSKRERSTPAPPAPPCVPSTCAAQGKNCGTMADGCGTQIQCGPDSCGDGYTCTDNRCLCPDGTAVCQGVCCQAGEVCQNGDGACCAAQGQEAACAGRVCGSVSDSCTGAVYACGPAGDDCAARGFTCTAGGQCQCAAPRPSCPPSGIAPTCCQNGQVCQNGNGACCTPTTCAAQGKNCGSLPDGCGGATLDCGSCPFPSQTCNTNVCSACVPNCAGKPCGGDDECGGTCTACSATCPTGACAACDVCQPTGTCGGCDGCCDASGECRDGRTTAVCGRAGETCVACAGEELCRADGQGAPCRLNQAPDAFNDTVEDVWFKTCVVVTLHGADPDGDPIAFRLVSTPPKSGRVYLYDAAAVDFNGPEMRLGDPAVPAEAGTDSLRVCYRTNNRFFFGFDSLYYVAVDTHGAETPFVPGTPESPAKPAINITIREF